MYSLYICDMLNLGLIGDIKLLEPFTHKAQEHPEVHVTGKSSVGIQPKPGSFKLQAPEFNRIELIERSDALFINRFSLLPFSLLCDMVKKSKHIFAVEYPELKPSEFIQLAKLAHEAKTVIQVKNSFYYLPAAQWMARNIKKPAFVEVTYFSQAAPDKNLVLQLILMLKDITGTLPKRTGAISFRSSPVDSSFFNVQLDYGDGSVVNLNFGKTDKTSRFEIRLFMTDRFVTLDLINDTYTDNDLPVNLDDPELADETESFINAILQKGKVATSMETFSTALTTMAMIQEKLNRYTTI
ncbi:MAG: hypothetical protein ACOC0R_00180 [Mariniphaga sp.]